MDVHFIIASYVMANGSKACTLVKDKKSAPLEECEFFSLSTKQAFEIAFANKYKTNEEQGKEA